MVGRVRPAWAHGGGMKEARRWKWAFVRGLPPKFLGINPLEFPFERNPSRCLQGVLDDAFSRYYHSPLDDILEGIRGIFYPSTRGRAKVRAAQRA